jgi:hypothetical protein
MAGSSVAERCRALDWRALLVLYGDLSIDSSLHAGWAALALRDKARAGELPPEAIPILALCLRDAEDAGTIVHLAKTLAAFGRDGAVATGFLIDKLRDLHVVDDATFWSWDGSFFSLGYIGDERAVDFVRELEQMSKPPVVRAGSVYDGDLPAKEREAMFRFACTRVGEMLADPEGATWTSRQTTKPLVEEQPKAKKGFWMVR